MRPSERRDVRQELRGNAESVALALRDSMAEVKRVPVDDDGGREVQAGYAEMLAFGGAVADFALTADAQGVLERVVRFALVEPNLGLALQFGVEQPVDDEERPLDPPDLAQRQGKIVLTRIGGELAQELAGRDGTFETTGNASSALRVSFSTQP